MKYVTSVAAAMFAIVFPRRMIPRSLSGLATMALMACALGSPPSACALSLRRLRAIKAVSAPEKKKDISRKKKSRARYSGNSGNFLGGSLDGALVGGSHRPVDVL